MNPTKTTKRHESNIGLLPPMDVQIEQAVLGAILLEKPALARALPLIPTDEIFYLEKHQIIMTAIRNLFGAGESVDLLTVTAEVRKMGKLAETGGVLYMTELTSQVAGAAHLEQHCRLLQEFWMKRTLIKIGSELQREGFSEETDVFDLMEKLQVNVVKLVEGVDNGRTATIREAMKEALSLAQSNMGDQGNITGVPTPYRYLNNLIGGWQKTDLVIIAARPAMGKTALMLALTRCALASETGVAIFSLEMSTSQLTNRLIVQETKVCTAQELSRGRLSMDQLKEVTARLNRAWNYNLHIDDTPGLSLIEFRSKAWALKTHHGIGMIVIDYLQLMSGERANGSTGNREQEISTISRGLKKVAKELELPIIALSQLSRAVETRGGDKRPQLSDLRESGAIEQDADMVFFLYRPEYYGFKEAEDGTSTHNLGELICAKHRAGGLGVTFMKWQPQFTDFVERDEPASLPVPEQPYGKIPASAKSDFDYDPSPDEYGDGEQEMPF